MNKQETRKGLTRRQLLSGSAKLGAAFIVGAGFVANPSASWALEVQHLKPETMDNVEAGIAALNEAAASKGHANYMGVGWERDRVDILRSMEDSPFFQTVRGGLVTGLYNQKAVWPLFGYEGESYSKGGYINRGFDDINWV